MNKVPNDPQPWKAGVDDSADPEMIARMHYVLDNLSHKTTVPDLIHLARMSAQLDQRTRLGYHVQCALLANVADRLEVIYASLPEADPAVVAHVKWYMNWGYFNGKAKDAWAVFQRRAIALYV
jgi:hypothetical protein